jgi:hypothetical protein
MDADLCGNRSPARGRRGAKAKLTSLAEAANECHRRHAGHTPKAPPSRPPPDGRAQAQRLPQLPDAAKLSPSRPGSQTTRACLTLGGQGKSNSNDLVDDSTLGFLTKATSLSLAERLSNYQANRRELETLQHEESELSSMWGATSKLRQRAELARVNAAVQISSRLQPKEVKAFRRILMAEPKQRERKDIRKLAEWSMEVDIFYGLTAEQVRCHWYMHYDGADVIMREHANAPFHPTD